MKQMINRVINNILGRENQKQKSDNKNPQFINFTVIEIT